MILIDLFSKNRVCRHVKVPADTEFAYCPDCGELVENQWYLSRCACCGVKLKSIIRSGEIVPEQRFCANCGTQQHITERINKINFIDIDFAVMVKTTVVNHLKDFTQSWVEPQKIFNPKLIVQNSVGLD
jgi:NMD protein affecting ribosome stability and mRNA decay